MKKLCLIFIVPLICINACFSEEIDLFILAGQSNAQGWQGDASYYPKDTKGLDKTIRFYWVTPGHSSSNGEWTTMKAQEGRFKKGHFGLEVTFARALKNAGYNPAIFKYSRGSTSLANNWKGPGDGKMYDRMVKEFRKALSLLRKKGHTVNMRCFIWIQGESDAKTPKMAQAYKTRLEALINDLRNNVTEQAELPVILGIDEQHPWVKNNSQVVEAQKALTEEYEHIAFTSMMGLKKADSTHLKPSGLEEHGKRIYAAYKDMMKGQQDKD